jgi:transposase-like protein
MNATELQKDALQLFCPNRDCPVRGKMGAGNLVSHGKKRERYKCKTCGKTFCARQGTMFVGLRKPEELIVIVVTLLAYGCPVQAIVHALGLDERTVARWQERAGAHCQKVHEDQVMQGKLDLMHVQADEIRGKGWKMIPWIGLAMMVSTRLWLGGVVSLHRDRRLADDLLAMVKACCQPLVALSQTLLCERVVKDKRAYLEEGGDKETTRSSHKQTKQNLFGGRPQWMHLVYSGRVGMSNSKSC